MRTENKVSDAPETDAFAKAMYKRGVDCHHDGREALKHAERLERERDEALLQLGAIQSAFAEELDLSFTPTSPDEMRQALRSLVACGTALAKAIEEAAK